MPGSTVNDLLILLSTPHLAPGRSATLPVNATDPDGDAVSITAAPGTLPPPSTSAAGSGGGTAAVTPTPAGLRPGTYVSRTGASDGKEGEREPCAVTAG